MMFGDLNTNCKSFIPDALKISFFKSYYFGVSVYALIMSSFKNWLMHEKVHAQKATLLTYLANGL